MPETHQREIRVYRTTSGREPFNEWLSAIRDIGTQARIRARLERLEDGNLGDCQSVGEGVFELRIHFGSGYRVYFGQIANTIILLLCGGDKSSQRRDIERAKTYWLEYKRKYL
ncbi:MAG: type II toxin-antitoxin system RelE/ParE family toxin [Candidatus Poribacteria bacterium]|nr:type II toxin-antitoxin system RelE/ParE family toxin [Candidatus Poribacteria bacterium]